MVVFEDPNLVVSRVSQQKTRAASHFVATSCFRSRANLQISESRRQMVTTESQDPVNGLCGAALEAEPSVDSSKSQSVCEDDLQHAKVGPLVERQKEWPYA